jgi:hypothetical protein
MCKLKSEAINRLRWRQLWSAVARDTAGKLREVIFRPGGDRLKSCRFSTWTVCFQHREPDRRERDAQRQL